MSMIFPHDEVTRRAGRLTLSECDDRIFHPEKWDVSLLETDKNLAVLAAEITEKSPIVKTHGGNTLARINPCIYYTGALWTISIASSNEYPYRGQFPVMQIRQRKDLSNHYFADLICYDGRIGLFPVSVRWGTRFDFYLGQP